MSPADTIRSLALGQALMVAPSLGDSYAGKTASTIAALLMMLADDLERMADRRADARTAMLALITGAEVDDPSLADDIARARAGELPQPLDARDSHLLALVAAVHAWADAHDPALAARCRRFLANWAEGERLHPPRLPA